MLGKRKRHYDTADLPPDRRFRANVSNLLSTNALTYTQAQSLIDDAHAGGHRGVRGLTSDRGAEEGASKWATVGGNVSRRLRRRLVRGSLWPRPYFAEVRCWNKRRSREQKEWVAFGLPHEYYAQLVKYGSLGKLESTGGLDKVGKEHVQRCLSAMQVDSMIPAGLWADGVPCQWDRDQTVELVCLNLPGLPTTMEEHKLRLPITGLMKASMSTNTWHDIFEVIAWSFRLMATGAYPAARHDGKAWLKSDFHRAKQASADLGYRSALVQMRADWGCWKNVFGFPQYNEKAGCCWRCHVTPQQAHLPRPPPRLPSSCSSYVSRSPRLSPTQVFQPEHICSTAPWRSNRRTKAQLIQHLMEHDVIISPMMSIPFVDQSVWRIDWLHAVDLGVAADWLGQMFFRLIQL